MNCMDLCTGWGRLIFYAALKSKLVFHTYDGIDINLSCKKKFEQLTRRLKIRRNKIFEVRFLERNILEFKS